MTDSRIATESSLSPSAPATLEASPQRKKLSPEAQRALAEAAERRNAIDTAAAARPREIQGRGGLEPVRYGDWEIKGLASDF